MSLDEEVSKAELFELVKHFSKYPYRARDTNTKVRIARRMSRIFTTLTSNISQSLSLFLFSFQVDGIQKKCLQLFAKDYKFTVGLVSHVEMILLVCTFLLPLLYK